jgi:hypothetical protein
MVAAVPVRSSETITEPRRPLLFRAKSRPVTDCEQLNAPAETNSGQVNLPSRLHQVQLIEPEHSIFTSNVFQRQRVVTYQGRSRVPKRKIVRAVGRNVTEEKFWLLNKWQGQITSVETDTFEADLFDLSDPSIVEHGKFLKTEVPPEDVGFIRGGAVFYWYVGYRDMSFGQRKRESIIWMRRSGRIAQERFEDALREVEKIWGAVGGADLQNPA